MGIQLDKEYKTIMGMVIDEQLQTSPLYVSVPLIHLQSDVDPLE